jgi:RNase adapter protein RapZ
MSFSFRRGLPREADLVFDARFLKNPHYVPELKPLTGRDAPVTAYIETDPDYRPFLDRLQGLIGPLLPRFDAEGKSYLTIAVGCTGGKHRSVAVAEALAGWLRNAGRSVSLTHRDVDLGRGRQGG